MGRERNITSGDKESKNGDGKFSPEKKNEEGEHLQISGGLVCGEVSALVSICLQSDSGKSAIQ